MGFQINEDVSSYQKRGHTENVFSLLRIFLYNVKKGSEETCFLAYQTQCLKPARETSSVGALLKQVWVLRRFIGLMQITF